MYGKRINNFQVFCPTSLTMCPDDSKEEMRATWGKDPVHLSKHGYAKEARALVGILDRDLNLERSSSRIIAPSPRADRPRIDWSANRQSWVSRSDATATRSYSVHQRQQEQARRGGHSEGWNRGGHLGSRDWRRGGHHGNRGSGSSGYKGKPY